MDALLARVAEQIRAVAGMWRSVGLSDKESIGQVGAALVGVHQLDIQLAAAIEGLDAQARAAGDEELPELSAKATRLRLLIGRLKEASAILHRLTHALTDDGNGGRSGDWLWPTDSWERLEAVAEAIDPTPPEAPTSASDRLGSKGDEPGEVVSSGPGVSDTDWNVVQGLLLVKRDRGEPYTSLRRLADELGVSEGTIRKAIANSPALKGWQARQVGAKAAPKATDLGEVVRDNTRQKTEPDPDDLLPDDDVDATMARLINQARPDERAKLNALNEAERRALVTAFQAQNLDAEPSPLEPNKPGKHAHKVTHHKRA